MDGFERITGREHDGLVEKCQENGWLKVGGFDWQDDPFLEEYPYEFSRTDSVDRLREALGELPRAARHCLGAGLLADSQHPVEQLAARLVPVVARHPAPPFQSR